jgi:hypothetical protein
MASGVRAGSPIRVFREAGKRNHLDHARGARWYRAIRRVRRNVARTRLIFPTDAMEKFRFTEFLLRRTRLLRNFGLSGDRVTDPAECANREPRHQARQEEP